MRKPYFSIFIIMLFGVMLFFCGCGSIEASYKKNVLFVNTDVDTVYSYALSALTTNNYTIDFTDKASGIIVASAGKNLILQNNPSKINLTIKKVSADKVTVEVKAFSQGQMIDYGISEKIVKNIITELQSHGAIINEP